MMLKPYLLKNRQKSIEISSPSKNKKPAYVRMKSQKNKLKFNPSSSSLNSLQVNRMSLNLAQKNKNTSRRKLLSINSIDHKVNFTQRKKPTQPIFRRDNIIDQIFKKQKGSKFRNDKMHTIDDQELDIKQNIIKGCIQQFQGGISQLQGVLKQITHQKSSRRILVSHRIQTQTTKKQPLDYCKDQFDEIMDHQKTRFGAYIRQIKNKKKQQKPIVLKVPKHKPNISILKIRETLDVSKLGQKLKKSQSYCNKQNEKFDLIKQRRTISVNQITDGNTYRQSSIPCKIIEECAQIDCSSIQKINQSSFISQYGKKSLLRQLENQNRRDQTKKTKKCLSKIKNLFPCDFF